MRAGRLRHVITIQQATETRDSVGAIIRTWATYDTVRASIEPLNGREYFNASQVQAEVSTRIRVRYLDGLTSKMRILFGSRIYDIKAIINDKERNFEMTLMCVETDAA